MSPMKNYMDHVIPSKNPHNLRKEMAFTTISCTCECITRVSCQPIHKFLQREQKRKIS